MPEEVTDVKSEPESSTGQTLTPPADAEGYSEWRLTGKVPKKPPQRETSARSTESAEAESGEKEEAEVKTSSVSETEPKQEHRLGKDEYRVKELLGLIKAAGFSGPAELRDFRKQVAQAQPVSPPVQQTSVNPPAPQPLTEPRLENFKSWDEFNAAQRAYNALMVDERIRQAAPHLLAQWQAQMLQEQAYRQAQERIHAAKQSYGEEAEGMIRGAATSLFGDQSIHPAVRDIVNGSPVIEHLLYVMGSDQDELEQFRQTARSNPGEALRRIVVLEQFVKDELHKQSNGASGRDESGRFTPAKKELPPPAREVSGRASLPPNEADAAFNRGDVRSYMNAKNREQIAARKGR